MAVPPHDDNWAAWSVVGPLAEAIAELLDGTEVTADPPPWLQKELAMEEVSAPERMPLLALRAPSVFPGMVKVVPFGRATSIATIERLLVTGQVRVALVLQHNPASEDPPAQVDDVEPIAVDARIVKAVRQEGQVLLVLKGIARLHVRDLDSKAELPAVTVAPSEPKPIVREGHAALRRFARFDPLVGEAAGTSLLSQIDVLDIGFVADLVAQASDDRDLATRTLLTIDPVQRASVVEAALGI